MTRTQKSIFAGLLVTSIAASVGFFIYSTSNPVSITEFNEARDMEPLLKSFYEDWYWLIDAEPHEYSAYEAFHTRTPDSWDRKYEGKLQIKILRDHGNFAGFVAYYPKNFYEGKVLYLNVRKEFRHKGYAQKLLRYAADDFFKQGMHVVSLITRPNNKPALALYTKNGFQEVARNEHYVTLHITKEAFYDKK